MNGEQRFKGFLSEEYQLINQALPHFEELQLHVQRAVSNYHKRTVEIVLKVIEIGCGSGATSYAILNARSDIYLVGIDNEINMINQAIGFLSEFIENKQCEIIHTDALEFFNRQKSESVDIVASALTLHNMNQKYRNELHLEIFRMLRKGGMFINADKYAPQDDNQRFKALEVAISRFFDAFQPLGKIDLLREWVIHNIADQSPDRCMKEQDTIDALRSIGFERIEILDRFNMEAVLKAQKP